MKTMRLALLGGAGLLWMSHAHAQSVSISPPNTSWRGAILSPLVVEDQTYGATTIDPSHLGVYLWEDITGTCVAGASCYANLWNTGSDVAAVNASLVENYFTGTIGGAAMTGNRAMMNVALLMNATTGNTTAGWSYSAFVSQAGATANDNGTDTTAANSRGILQGLNNLAIMRSGATNWYSLKGDEIDMEADTGSSMYSKIGLEIVQQTSDQIAGSGVDDAIAIANMSAIGGGTGTIGWKIGIAFGGASGYWPIQATGTAIASVGAGTLANVLDFSSATVSGYFLKGPGGFTVDGSANEVVASAGVTGIIYAGVTKPTPSGACSVNTQTGGMSAGTFKANGACTSSTVILTFNTNAPTGFTCDTHDITTPAQSMNETSTTISTVTFTGTMLTGDVVAWKCEGF
jgi:hypothetical protein